MSNVFWQWLKNKVRNMIYLVCLSTFFVFFSQLRILSTSFTVSENTLEVKTCWSSLFWFREEVHLVWRTLKQWRSHIEKKELVQLLSRIFELYSQMKEIFCRAFLLSANTWLRKRIDWALPQSLSHSVNKSMLYVPSWVRSLTVCFEHYQFRYGSLPQ